MSTARIADYVIGEVRAHMARQRLTGTALAEAMSISQQSVSDRLNGRVALTLDEVYSIAEWLGVSPLDLLPSQRAGVSA